MICGQPVPLRFAAQVARLSPNGLSLHYHVGRKTVARWLATLPADAPRFVVVRTPPRSKATAIPADFAEVAMVTTVVALAKRYGIGCRTVQTWLRALPDDVRETRRRTMRAARAASVNRRAPTKRKGRGPSMLAKFDGESNRTRADLAAMHLQRRFVPVVRASIYGKQFVGLWQVGRLKMPETEMVALAVKQGWAL